MNSMAIVLLLLDKTYFQRGKRLRAVLVLNKRREQALHIQAHKHAVY